MPVDKKINERISKIILCNSKEEVISYCKKLLRDLLILEQYEVISSSMYTSYVLDIYDKEQKFLEEYGD